MNNNKRGKLISFEGPDGSGKTTQIELLEDYLKGKGYNIIKTREPGGTPISEKIRDVILDNGNKEMCGMCEALLYAASRAQLVEEVIKPSINDGKIVICDRFVHSSLVYQGIARNLGVDRIRGINDAALNGLTADLVIMLNMSYEEGLRRKQKQQVLDRIENSGDDFHKKVFEGYMKIAEKSDKIEVVDASGSVEVIHHDIIKLMDKILNI